MGINLPLGFDVIRSNSVLLHCCFCRKFANLFIVQHGIVQYTIYNQFIPGSSIIKSKQKHQK